MVTTRRGALHALAEVRIRPGVRKLGGGEPSVSHTISPLRKVRTQNSFLSPTNLDDRCSSGCPVGPKDPKGAHFSCQCRTLMIYVENRVRSRILNRGTFPAQ